MRCWLRKSRIRARAEIVAAAFVVSAVSLISPASGQLLKKSDYGAGMTVALYQFDDARSKETPETMPLKQTSSTPEEEIDYMSRMFGIEGLKLRHVRSIGLREGEPFTDIQTVNEKPFTFTLKPRTVTREEVRFDLTVTYAEQSLLALKDITIGNYETLALRGGHAQFGVREFIGPSGTETVPERRALLVTITATIAPVRGLQNRPTDVSRPTDQFGTKVTLSDTDVYIMPSVLARIPPKFLVGNPPKGSITLEGIVTPEGRVTNVRVLDSPDPAYNSKAIEAFRGYRFNPARLNGAATYAFYRETIIFSKPGPP